MADSDVGALLERAVGGDEDAWEELISRFERVVWSVTYGFSFDDATRHDVFQLTWLRLLDNADRIREPERLAGWLATTARRECLAIVRSASRLVPTDQVSEAEIVLDESSDRLIRDERVAAVAEALGEIGARCQQLLGLLTLDPPMAYTEIAEVMDMPIGAIGPTRARCLDKLLRRPAILGITADDSSSPIQPGARRV